MLFNEKDASVSTYGIIILQNMKNPTVENFKSNTNLKYGK